MQNPYDTLGVSQQSNDADIKKAYRKMAMQYHPDKGGDDKKFAEINNAYDSIKDADSRMQFEQSQHNPSNFQQSQNNGFAHNFGDFNDIFNNILAEHFKNVKGKFLGIGAHIGLDWGFPLLEQGWQGVYCEPDPFNCSKLFDKMPMMKPNKLKVTQLITRSAIIQTG